MSQQAQIFVEKQGSMQKGNWTSRILTLDTASGTATVSCKNRPSKVLHHTLRISDIRKFPHVDLAGSKINPDSAEAKWTICVLGCKAPIPDLSAEHAEAVDPFTGDNDSNNAQRDKQSSASSDSTPAADAPVKKGHAGVSASDKKAVSEHWLIRCTSQDTYDLAVRLLQRMLHANGKAEADVPRSSSNTAVMPAARTPAVRA